MDFIIMQIYAKSRVLEQYNRLDMKEEVRMKVQELRNLLSTADRERLEKAFAESYKKFSKQQKEEVDLIIGDILEGKDTKEANRKEAVNFEKLEQEITVFIENAYAQNYYAPNRIIPKSQRPKWRFLVKNFIKELEKIQPESENYPTSVKLLTDLYRLICYACNVYLFSTDDAFRSIGWEQSQLFQLLVKKTFGMEYSEENISKLLLLAATGGLSRESLYVYQELVLLGELKTADVKYMAIEEAKKLVKERQEKLKGLGKYDRNRYYLEYAVNELCGIVLMISVQLAEAETGIPYFFGNCMENNKEIVLYRALDLMNMMDEDDMWIQIYEYGVKKKIKPREFLQESYQKRINIKMENKNEK